MKLLEECKHTSETLEETQIFSVLDFYLSRTPFFSIELFYKIFNESGDDLLDKLKLFIANEPIFREALAVSSPTLYDSIKDLDHKKTKKAKQVYNSLINYFIRMCTRPTPFGLMAGVNLGAFGDKTETRIEKSRSEKNSRPDMLWLMNVVKLLERNKSILFHLQIKSNNLLIQQGDILKNPYLSQYGLKMTKGVQTARYFLNQALLDVLQYTKQPTTFNKVFQLLCKKYSSVSNEKILNYMIELVDKEVLITSLRPSLLNGDPFKQLLLQIKSCLPNYQENKLCKLLFEIDQDLDILNSISIGDGESKLCEIIEKMKSVVNCGHFVQVDLLSNKKIILNKSIKKDIARAAQVIFNISSNKKRPDHLETFYKEFISEYGFYCEVPLLVLLDDAIGIGAPATYKNPPSQRASTPSPINSKRMETLSEWLMETVMAGKTELILDENMIKRMSETNENFADAPDSMELYFTISAKSPQHVDNGCYTLTIVPNTGSIGAGKSFGRFYNMFNLGQRDKLKRITEFEQQMNPKVIFAELSCLPTNAKAMNIMLTTNNYDYEISIATDILSSDKKRIELSDLVIGANGTGLYLKSKSLNKEVIPVANHMMNNGELLPNAYRLLLELGAERNKKWEQFNWGYLNKQPFLPRVTYSNIILSLASWRMNKMQTMFCKVNNSKDWNLALNKWKSFYKVPNYIYLTVHDHKLLLDLNNECHKDILFQYFSKLGLDESLHVTEMGYLPEECWVKDPYNQHFVMEVVCPIIKNDTNFFNETNVQKNLLSQSTSKEYIPKSTRYKGIGNDWLYIKLYGNNETQNELLVYHIKALCHKAEKNKIIEKSFFIRYTDPRPHIRLRFHGNADLLLQNLFPEISSWSENLIKNGLINNIVIEGYNPEIERYGGKKLISIAEQIFAEDSKVCYALLDFKESEKLSIPFEFAVILSMVHMLDKFGYSHQEQLNWINDRSNPKNYKNEFRSFGKMLLHLSISKNRWENLMEHSDGVVLLEIFEKRGNWINHYANELNKVYPREHSNDFDNIVASIIHVHLNRLGIHLESEAKIMSLLNHTLYNIRFYMQPKLEGDFI